MYNRGTYGIAGRNFSGRSHYLKSMAEEMNVNGSVLSGIYLRPNSRESLSSLSETVSDELSLHINSRKNPNIVLQSKIKSMISVLPLRNLLHRNPLTLSGGEQSTLATISKLLLAPEFLGIDCTLEQVDKDIKTYLLSAIDKEFSNYMDIQVVDNRLFEQDVISVKNLPKQIDKEDFENSYHFEDINSKYQFSSSLIDEVNLIIQGLTFEYVKGVKVLHGVSFELKPGNIYQLDGKNGSGKTTLAKILSGILKYQNGEISVNNRPYNPYRHPGKLISYSYQDPDVQIFNPYSVIKELTQTKKQLPDELKERLDIILKIFGLTALSDINPFELPLTLRKRIAIAGSLFIPRPIYIFDEPTLWQDDINSFELAEIFKNLSKQGTIIVIISHSKHFFNLLNAKKIHLDNGSITKDED